MSSFNVFLYIYDLSRGTAKLFSPSLLGKQIDGIWHTSIVIHGKEYYFGSEGISSCQPGTTMLGEPLEKIPLGSSEVTPEILESYLAEVGSTRFKGELYKLFEHNCNTFSSELAIFLTGNGIPSHITDLPNSVLQTQFGQMIKSTIENLNINPNGSQNIF